MGLRQRTMLDVWSHIEDHTVDFWDYHREHTVGPAVDAFVEGEIEPSCRTDFFQIAAGVTARGAVPLIHQVHGCLAVKMIPGDNISGRWDTLAPSFDKMPDEFGKDLMFAKYCMTIAGLDALSHDPDRCARCMVDSRNTTVDLFAECAVPMMRHNRNYTPCTDVPPPDFAKSATATCGGIFTASFYATTRCANDNRTRVNDSWVQNKYCQRSCFEMGAGYAGDECPRPRIGPCTSNYTAYTQRMLDAGEYSSLRS